MYLRDAERGVAGFTDAWQAWIGDTEAPGMMVLQVCVLILYYSTLCVQQLFSNSGSVPEVANWSTLPLKHTHHTQPHTELRPRA